MCKISSFAVLLAKLWLKEHNVLHNFVPSNERIWINIEHDVCVNLHLSSVSHNFIPNTTKLRIFQQYAEFRITNLKKNHSSVGRRVFQSLGILYSKGF